MLGDDADEGPAEPGRCTSTSISATIRAGITAISTAGQTTSRSPRDACKLLGSWLRTDILLATDAVYNDPKQCPAEPAAVLIGCPPADLAATAARYTCNALG